MSLTDQQIADLRDSHGNPAIRAMAREIQELRKDRDRLNWLGRNDVIQQEVGSEGWRIPELDFREAIDAARASEERG